MKIKKLITINWANLPNREYLFGDLVFITGETGVGKSTMLDAIQTIMTGGKDNLTLYNAGQDEAQNKKRNKEYRTLEGYCVGEDRFKFARPNGTITTIAITFYTKDKKPFTALINIKVSMEIYKGEFKPKRDNISFFIIKNRELFIDDLIGENSEILNHKQIYKNLCNEYNANNIIKCDTMGEYLNTLYGHLWGESSTTSIFSEKAARAFSNFIHAKPVEDINTFVRKEFLESKVMSSEVENLSQIIHSLNALKREAKEVEEEVTALKLMDSRLTKLLHEWFDNHEQHYLYQTLERLKQKEKIRKQQKEYDKKAKELKKSTKELEKFENEKSTNNEALQKLRSTYAGNDNLLQINQIETDIKREFKQFNESSSLFFSKLQKIDVLYGGLKLLYLHSDKFQKLCNLFEEFYSVMTNFSTIEFAKLVQKNSIEDLELSTLLSELEVLMENLSSEYSHLILSKEFELEMEKVSNHFQEQNLEILTKQKRLETLQEEITQLEENQFYAPSHISKAFNTLQMILPDANAKMLYEFVDLTNDEWRESIEGFIAGNRFTVLVNSKYEREAIDIVKNEKLNLKIIQGKKVLKDIERRGKALDSDSILKHLSINHETIEAYLINSYGDVLCVDSSETLTHTRRGVTKDTKASSNNLMFDCSLKEKRFIFGKRAREKTLENLKQEFQSLKELKNTHSAQRDIFAKIIEILKSFKSSDDLLATHNIHKISESFIAYHKYLKLKASIDISDIQEIKEEMERREKALGELEPQIKYLTKQIGIYENILENREHLEQKDKEELNVRQERQKEREDRLSKLYSMRISTHSFEEYITKLNATVSLSSSYLIPKSLKEVIVNHWSAFYQAYNSDTLLRSKRVELKFLLQYSELFAHEEQYIELYELHQSIMDEISRIENSPLYQFKEKIAKKNEEFKDIFTRDFCQVIYTRIEQGKNYIDKLNKVLKNHTFGNEIYQIKRKEGNKELKEYYDYFKTISINQSMMNNHSLFGVDEYQEESDAIANKLLNLFTDKDKYNSELARISDYRNYFNYDILQIVDTQEISLSRNGKNSGGQGETSYYIIRSLNLQSALKSHDKRKDALESAIIDESFLKLNVERSKAILTYLTDTLGFQVICAMPTKQVGSFFDLSSSNYNIVQAPLRDKLNGELDYQTFVTFNETDSEEIKKLTQEVERTLFDTIVEEANRRYAK